MPEDAQVWQALLRAKGLTVAQLAEDLETTRQHAHRLLTGRRSGDSRRDELDRALALGPRRTEGRPLYAVAMLGRDGDLELLPAGDVQPLYADRELAASVAERLDTQDLGVCVVPVWPEYAWRRTVAFHAAWGSSAEPRNVFLLDDPEVDVPLSALVDEVCAGYAETLRLRAVADDPEQLQQVEALIQQTPAPAPEPTTPHVALAPAAAPDDDAEETPPRSDETLADRIQAWVGPDEVQDSTGN
jgi:hypothetical protein